MRQRPRPLSILAVVMLIVGAVVALDVRASTASIPGQQATPGAAPAVSAEVLAHGTPATSPGEELSLARVTVPPGGTIPAHEHPGLQLASIVSGTLSYTVLTGEVPVTRAAVNGTPGPVERITAGQTVALRPGDAVAETPGAIHMAHNAGAEPVVILLSRLFEAGMPATMFVDATPVP